MGAIKGGAMKFTFLGSGSVKSSPVYGCDCQACLRALDNEVFARHPACGYLQVNDKFYLIDAGYPALDKKFPSGSLDAVFLTHYHMDHVQGLFPIRWGIGESVPVFSPDDPNGCDDLYKYPGIFDFSNRSQPFETFQVDDVRVTPLPLVHSKLTMGYVFEYQNNRFAYLCDSGRLRRDVEAYLLENPVDLLVLDCDLPPMDEPPRNHNDLTRALDIFSVIKPKQLVLTHISHNLDGYFLDNPDCLPNGVAIGYDNQTWIVE